jgi:hypothetical protein
MGVDFADYTLDIEYQKASDYGLIINFPVNITGEGDSTVVDIMKVFNDYPEDTDDRTSTGDKNNFGLIVLAPGTVTAPGGNSGLLDNGFASFSSFRMRLCCIEIHNGLVEGLDDAGSIIKLNWGVSVDKVVFDRSEKTTHHSNENFGVIQRAVEIDFSADYHGNITVSNSQFLNSNISFESDADYLNNIIITNNTLRGSGDGTVDVSADPLINVMMGGNLTSCAGAPKENKIVIYGNINADNDGSAPAYIEQSIEWGDRVGTDIMIPGSLTVCGGISMGGLDTEIMTWPMYRKRSYFFSKSGYADDPAGAQYSDEWIQQQSTSGVPGLAGSIKYFHENIHSNYAEFGTGLTVDSRVHWPAVEVYDTTYWAGVDDCAVPLLVNVPYGERIVRVELYRDSNVVSGILGGLLEIKLKVFRFSEGLPMDSDFEYVGQPLEYCSSSTYVHENDGSFMIASRWTRCVFDANMVAPEDPLNVVHNNTSNTSKIHDQYLLNFSVSYPNCLVGTGDAKCIFYKVHVITEIDDLQSALGLHSE